MITWLFPERCPVCNKPVLPRGSSIHAVCDKKVWPIKEPICKRCGTALSDESAEYCENCESMEAAWDSGRCLYRYQSVVQRALLQVKQEGIKEWVRFFGTRLARQYQTYINECHIDCIVPVPLHKRKLRQRGFNQAELLARELAVCSKIPVRLLLVKKEKTKDQKTLSKEQRKRNLSHAFAIDTKLFQEGKIPCTVLLVDDVYTTGSTMHACATVLKQCGVQRVYFLCVCSNTYENESD